MDAKIGVFICNCANNIKNSIDTEKLMKLVADIEGVAEVSTHALWCSEAGREEISRTILEKQLNRVVIAACSPKQHEKTFQKVMSSSGLNPYLMQMANIREQVAWVTPDKDQATQKAMSLLASAINRVKLNEPLENVEMDIVNDFVVIGAGVAGLSAALALAQKGRKVYLVEREPWVGGKIVSYEELFPKLECAPCMIEPLIAKVLENDRIVTLTNSEVENVRGFFGNFEVRIRQKARLINADKCIGCGECFEPCPIKVKNKFNGNLSDRHAVFTAFPGSMPNLPIIDTNSCLRFKGVNCDKCEKACPFGAIDYSQKDNVIEVSAGAIIATTGFSIFDTSSIASLTNPAADIFNSSQFERMLSSTGPTSGKIVKSNGKPPSSIAFIHCIGSRDKRYKEYCSGVCCANSIKQGFLARLRLNANLQVYEFFSEMCLPGKGYQEFVNSHRDIVKFIRVRNTNDIRLHAGRQTISVDYESGSIEADMVVLAPAMQADEYAVKTAETLGLKTDTNGFFISEHDKLFPSNTLIKGIYAAGCATGPKDISASVLSAIAAAGDALSKLVPGEKIALETAVAQINEDKCCGCRTCVQMCPYEAIAYDHIKNVSRINQVLCRGCGTCVVSCPTEAISNKAYDTNQILSELEGILL